MTAQIVIVTGTSTDVGKTVAVAALAASARAAGLRVAVCKAAQTGVGPGEDGDLAEVVRLAGGMPTAEPARFPEPLAPETAAARAGLPPVTVDAIVDAVVRLAADVDVVLVEGAGGVLVRLAPDTTILDVADGLRAQGWDPGVVVVTDPGLGTLNHTELTTRAVAAAGLRISGLLIGSWPTDPDLAMRCNLDDLPRLTGVPVVGSIRAGAAALDPAHFRAVAPRWVSADLFTASNQTQGELTA